MTTVEAEHALRVLARMRPCFAPIAPERAALEAAMRALETVAELRAVLCALEGSEAVDPERVRVLEAALLDGLAAHGTTGGAR
ncbi:MAG: hypothetical protein H6721_31245 [Sandaracinus sp.]|nr:hypothetical protein [Sandaracinus sp.]MCB9636608.1 hypothetical protein [Sandaracinus sp.]